MIHIVKKLNINIKIHTEHVGSLCSSWSIHHSSALSEPRVCHGPPGIHRHTYLLESDKRPLYPFYII
jgi:hypothetical protein